MRIGFSVVAGRDGAAVNRHGAGEGPMALVSAAADPGGRCVLMGRLYYRDDAVARLGRRPDEADNPAALALALYRRFGAAGLETLEGDFALALHDGAAGRVIALRDPMGAYPLYWMARAGGVALATGLRPLVDFLPARELDIGFLGEVQVAGFGEPVHREITAFAGISRLLPGAALEADLATGRIATRRWWRWLDRAADPGTDDVAEAGRRYRALFDRAVAERMVGTVAAQLSGGIDSTAVGYVAADEAARRGARVHALSLVYDTLPGLDIEKPYIDLALDRQGLVPHRLAGEDVLDYDVFRTAAPHDEPFGGLFRVGLDVAMTAAAAKAGATTMMTGLGADELFAAAPYYMADWLRSLRWRAAWREAALWSKAYNTSVWKMLRPFGLAPLVPVPLMDGLGTFLRGGRAPWTRQTQTTIGPWVKRDFARTAAIRDRALDYLRLTYRAGGTVVRSEALARLTLTAGSWAGHAIVAPAGIHETHPFRDSRLLAFGLGARERIRPPPGRQQKPILAAAFRGLLPAPILDRRSKGTFNAIYYRGLARNLPALEALIRDSKAEDMGLFDKTTLLDCVRDMALGVRGLDGMVGLNGALATMKWLALLPRWLAEAPAAPRPVPAAPAGGAGRP